MTSENSRTDSPRGHALRGFLLVLLAVTFWGGSAALAKYLILSRFDTLIITQTRTSLSFLLLAAFFAVADRSVFRIDLRDLGHFALLGILGIAITNYTYYYTASRATVATAILVQYTAPVWVTLYGALIGRDERIGWLKILSLILAFAGCGLAVSGGVLGNIRLPGWTVITAPLSALTFAFQIITTRRILRRYGMKTVLVYMFGMAGLFWLFINPPSSIVAHAYSFQDWGILLLFAVVSILIPQTAFTASLRLLDASTVGIMGTLEPIIAIVAAYVALGEGLSTVQIVGAVGVVGAVLLLQLGTNAAAMELPAKDHEN